MAGVTGLAEVVLASLRARGQTLGAAESLTGGLVSAALTDVPGSSDVVRGGVVSYATAVKVGLLGVPEAVVERDGVVSRACALAMAEGVRGAVGADWGLATTGVAGPGPSEGHAAGTVHIAVVGPPAPGGESPRGHRMLQVDGSRTQVRAATVEAVLELLRDTLEGPVSEASDTVGTRSQIDGEALETETAKEG